MSGPRLPNSLDDNAMEHFRQRHPAYVSHDPRVHATTSLSLISKYDDYSWQDSLESGEYAAAVGQRRPSMRHIYGKKRLSFQE